MDLTSTPDLQDFLKMEADLDPVKRSGSPVNVGIPISQNSSRIMTPAKVLMHGEPGIKSEQDNDSDGNATDTTLSAGDISINSEDALDGIKSPSPATAEAMENMLAADELSTVGTISNPISISQLETITKTSIPPQTSVIIKPKPNTTFAKVIQPQPVTSIGKKIAITTAGIQQPIQIIKKDGGGGPILTKYIVKRTNNSTGIAVSKNATQVILASSLNNRTPNSSGFSSPVKAISQSGSNIILSPIKGGFKIPISPMKSPIKVSVIPPAKKLGAATNKLQTYINAAMPMQVNSGVHQYKMNEQGNISVQMVPNSSATLVNGIGNRTFTANTQIRVQQKKHPQIVQTKPGNNSMLQQVNLLPSGGQPLQVNSSGIKYQYVQIVNPNTSQTQPSMRPPQGQQQISVNPVSTNSSNISLNSSLVIQSSTGFQRITQNMPKNIPQAQTIRVAVPPMSTSSQVKPQRLIMPATSLPQIMPNLSGISSNQIIPASGNLSYAMVPAKYVQQLTNQLNTQNFNQDNSQVNSPQQQTQPVTKPSANGKSRKPCNCTKSQCLKLYCECFANGHFCDGCNCNHCFNNLEHDNERSKAIKLCLERNPNAFRPKIGRGKDDHRTHQKGCNCKRSGCLKNYCECYEARIPCTSKCKCIGCKNYEETNDRRSLMSLADAAEVREKQQLAAKNKLFNQIGDLRVMGKPVNSAGERLPYTFFTQEVIEATCTCLLAQAEEAEKTNRSMAVAETMILEEFGRCLMQIIQSAGKAKVTNMT